MSRDDRRQDDLTGPRDPGEGWAAFNRARGTLLQRLSAESEVYVLESALALPATPHPIEDDPPGP